MPKIRWYAGGLVVAFLIFFALGGFDFWHTVNAVATQAAVIVAAILSCLKFAQESISDWADPASEYHTLSRGADDARPSLLKRVW